MTKQRALRVYLEALLTGDADPEEYAEAVEVAFNSLAEKLNYHSCDGCAHDVLFCKATENSPAERTCGKGLSLYYEKTGICDERE